MRYKHKTNLKIIVVNNTVIGIDNYFSIVSNSQDAPTPYGNKNRNRIQKMLKKYTDKNRNNDFKVRKPKSKPRFIPSNDSPRKDFKKAVI